jgi:hypothetical protein
VVKDQELKGTRYASSGDEPRESQLQLFSTIEASQMFRAKLSKSRGVSVMKRCKYLVPEARLQGGVHIRSFIFHIFLVGVALNSATVAQAQSKTPSAKGSQIQTGSVESARVQNVPIRSDRPQTDQEKADQARNVLYVHSPSNTAAVEPNAMSTHAPPAPYAGPKVLPSPIVNRGPLPHVVGGKDGEKEEEENTDNLLRAWRNRKPMAEVQKAVHESLTMPSEPQNPRKVGTSMATPATTPGTLTTDSWEQIGSGDDNPDGVHYEAGRIRQASYAYDNTVGATTLWLGATGGGLWKAVDLFFAVVFVPMSDNLPGSPSVGAFLVRPGNSNNILIGSGDTGRYAGTGMYKTSDGAATWHPVYPTDGTSWPSTFQKILTDLHDPSGQTVLAQGDTGIWLSTNFGDTWSRVYSGPSSDLVQDPVNTYIWYTGVEGVGVLRSTSYGQFFNPIGSGITGPIGRVSLAVSASAPEHLYAITAITNSNGLSTSLGGIWRSDDYGDGTWNQLEPTDQISGQGQAWHTTSINVDPNNADVVFAGMASMEVTYNGTASTPTWKYSSKGQFDEGHTDHTGYVFEPGTSNVISTSDGGVYVLDENSLSVSASLNYNTNLNVEQVYGPVGDLACSLNTPDECISGLQDNGSITINRNNTPALVKTLGGDGAAVSIAPNDANELFDMSNGGRYYTIDDFNSQVGDYGSCLTNNFYATTMIDQTPPNGFTPYIYTFSVPGSGGNYSYIYYKPVDSNCDWSVANPFGFDINAFSPRSMDVSNDPGGYVFYVAGWSTAFLEVADSYSDGPLGSMGYENRTPPVSRNSSFNDSQVAADRSSSRPYTVTYTTGSARPSQAFLSNDRGQSWTEVTGDLVSRLPSASYWKLIANPQDQSQLFLATDQGIYRSDNFGVNWYRYMSGMPDVANISGMELNYDNANPPLLHIGTYGRGFWDRQVQSDVVLQSLTLNPIQVVGGQDALFDVTIDRPAPRDITITLTSSNPSIYAAPASVTIAQGYSDAALEIKTSTVTSRQLVTVAASYNQRTPSAVLTVTLAPTATKVVTSKTPAPFGHLVTFTAAVTSSYGSPAGTVTFLDGSSVIGNGTISSGNAVFTTSTLGLGTHSIKAVYAGAGNFAASTSTSISQVVTQATTATALSSSANPSVFGANVTFTATVTSNGGVPIGAVTLKLGTAILGTRTLSGGHAAFSTSALTVGSHNLTATYAGNADYTASGSAALLQKVIKAASSTSVSSSVNPSSFHQSVSFKGSVKSATGGVPTGTITFMNGTTPLGSATLTAGAGNITISTLAVGTRTISASYGGNADYNASTSAALAQIVHKATTKTAVGSSRNPSKSGQTVTFTATVSPAFGGDPTGLMTFKDGSVTIGTGPVNATTHKAIFTTTKLAKGTHSITADYAGNADFAASSSAAIKQVVQ